MKWHISGGRDTIRGPEAKKYNIPPCGQVDQSFHRDFDVASGLSKPHTTCRYVDIPLAKSIICRRLANEGRLRGGVIVKPLFFTIKSLLERIGNVRVSPLDCTAALNHALCSSRDA